MKKLMLTLYVLLLMPLLAFSPDDTPYAWYTGDGKKTDWNKVVNEASKADIILFGEQHDNAFSHWYEYLLAGELTERFGDRMVFGCEMFESDHQLILNEYLSGKIDSKKLEDYGLVWKNYKNDYKPIIDVAKAAGIPVVATNIPRRYASMVYSGGFEALDGLSPEAKALIAPLPVLYDSTVKCYADLYHAAMGGHGGINFPRAQAIKDATMAYFILKHWQQGKKFYHWNGAYHSNRAEGIAWYLRQMNPDLKIFVISNVEQKNLEELDESSRKLGNAVLVTQELFPGTY